MLALQFDVVEHDKHVWTYSCQNIVATAGSRLTVLIVMYGVCWGRFSLLRETKTKTKTALIPWFANNYKGDTDENAIVVNVDAAIFAHAH